MKDFTLLLSNEFISWYNKIQENVEIRTLYPTVDNLFTWNIINHAKIINNNISYLEQISTDSDQIQSGNYLFRFKGEPVYLNVLLNNVNNTDNDLYVLNNKVVQWILRNILFLANYNYDTTNSRISPITPLLPLQKGSQSYDVIIGEDLQKKIDYLCAQMPTVEWSGTLFYKIEGDFNNEDKLKVRAFDLYLQDIGSSTYTAFNISPDLISYMCDQPELLEDDVFMGLIHSHNNMSTFFSGTDTSTLQKEGTEKDNFVSLIVNNHRKYTAGITSKCTQKRTIKQISFYKTFFNKIVEKEEEIDVESEIIEWYDLKVYMPENNHFDILDKCITDIKQTKEKAKTIVNNKQTNSISPRTPILAGTKIIPPTFNSAYDFDLNI